MFAGQAPPFGWYWSASRSRASAPSASAIRVTSPVAFGWLVESSPRACGLGVAAAAGREHDGRRVDRVLAADRAPAVRTSARAPGAARSRTTCPSRLPGLAQPLRDRMPGAVADLEQPLLRGAAAAREPVAAVLAGELDAELLEPVDRAREPRRSAPRRARGSAVSCEERQTSSACCSGESSAPKAAWIPPWALEELFACSEPFVATATRAPARSAETAAARPEAPLPTTSTSNETSGGHARNLSQSQANL